MAATHRRDQDGVYRPIWPFEGATGNTIYNAASPTNSTNLDSLQKQSRAESSNAAREITKVLRTTIKKKWLCAASEAVLEHSTALIMTQKRYAQRAHSISPRRLHASANLGRINNKISLKAGYIIKDYHHTVEDLMLLERAQRLASGDPVLIEKAHAEEELQEATRRSRDANNLFVELGARSPIPSVDPQDIFTLPLSSLEEQYINWD